MPKIFAHRGFSGRYPENTMLAFERMVATGCAGTELDVQMTADGQLVIIHDEALARTTNGTGYVWDYDLATLQGFLADGAYGGKVPNQRIPTLAEYFDFIKDTGLITNIELKTGLNPYPGIEQKVVEMIRAYKMQDRVWISSFNHETLVRCRQLAPELSYGALVNCWILDTPAYLTRMGAATLNAETGYLLHRENVEALHAAGLGAQAWTVNTPERVRQLLDNGVDCIISNFPDMAMETLRQWEREQG